MKNNQNLLYRKTLLNFLIKFGIWTLSVPLVIFVVAFIVSHTDYQYVYDFSPTLYYSVKTLTYHFLDKFNIIIYTFLIWIVGASILLYKLLKKVFSYINAISKASTDLMNKDIEYVELPIELENLQRQMNHLKRESERNELFARESEQRKNDLVVYLAHDLKTPLTSMIGYLSLIDEMKDMPKKKREDYIKIVLDKSYKLEDLINELFDITRFNSETIILEKEEINLNMMLEQIIDDFYPILKDNNKEIKLKINEKILLNGDPNKLARVFGNLIKNAINYSTDNLILIEVKKNNSNAEVIITNKGKKISEEKLKRIFEKFYRVDSSRTTRTGGSGLGLAIAKEIVELHNGNIKATSDENFTKFYVELPIKEKTLN